jgi:hypothetical protein
MADADEAVAAVLWRTQEIDSITALVSAFLEFGDEYDLSKSAIIIDSNVFLNMSGRREDTDALDYLDSTHSNVLVIPGQSIQEFWNNHLNAVNTVTVTLKKKIDDFAEELSIIDDEFDGHISEMKRLLEAINEHRGHVYSRETADRTVRMLERLKARAIVPYADRSVFVPLAKHRKITKTPPGFKDASDGDFFVWVDALVGLWRAKNDGRVFDRVVLVTDDKKMDWSRHGVAHPILTAEVQSLLGVPFVIWSLKAFKDAAREAQQALAAAAAVAGGEGEVLENAQQ